MHIPGHGNADAFVPLCGNLLDQFLSNRRIAPGRFIGSRRVKRIPEVPARLHRIDIGLQPGGCGFFCLRFLFR
ncbi:hypothetical protein D3C81_2098810 [compost metagenome]